MKQKEIDTAKQEQEKARVEAETKKVQAQVDAETLLIQAKAEAEANQVLANSVTENLIKMKEAEARLKHGWVEVQSNGSVITNH